MPKVLVVYSFVALTFIGVAAVDHAVYSYSRYLRALLLLQHYETRVSRLEYQLDLQSERLTQLQARDQEFQTWRVYITNVSRMGWEQASIYRREYPYD